jgi:hypothetical protein
LAISEIGGRNSGSLPWSSHSTKATRPPRNWKITVCGVACRWDPALPMFAAASASLLAAMIAGEKRETTDG